MDRPRTRTGRARAVPRRPDATRPGTADRSRDGVRDRPYARGRHPIQARAGGRGRAPAGIDARGRAVPRARGEHEGGRLGARQRRAVPRVRDGRPGRLPGYRGRHGPRPRPGYRYAYHYRGGYGYYRPWRLPRRYRHVHFAGYPAPHVYGTYFYFPGFSFGAGFGYGSAVHVGVGRPYSVYGHPYGWRDPYVRYGYAHVADAYTGFLRLKVRPRSAEVHVDGYFVGVVNEFDGLFQRLRIEEGPHTVELRHPGYEPLALDVLIVPGEKVTFEGDMIPLP